MLGINNLLDRWSYNRVKDAFTRSNYSSPIGTINIGENLPAWVALSCPEHFEHASRFNPIVKANINLIATSASNGIKYLKDIKTGEEIDWTDKSLEVQKIKRLLSNPNPLQSGREFETQGIFYLKTFGNRYVYGLMPAGFDKELDIMNIEVMYNLPSQFIQVKTTGKIYSQTTLEGIISEYARTNSNPVDRYPSSSIMHYNEVNISSEAPSVMGVSKLEVLRDPIKNTQAAFQAMNSILVSRGMQGIISIDSKDGTGTIVPLNPADKKEVDEKFKNDYGLLNGQNPFLISPIPLNYIKTAMSSKDMGIYEEFSNNAILIANEFNNPPELVKTYMQGTTYENQEQSVKRLYENNAIPIVDGLDQVTNYRLNLEKYGLQLCTKWDHIPALSENKKDNATTNSMNEKSAKSGYDDNLITWNQYLEATGRKVVDGGDIYKYEREAKIPKLNNE